MRLANILTGLAIIAWFTLAMLGRAGLIGIVAQKATGYPNMEQINYYALLPLFVVIALLLFAWLANVIRRWSLALSLSSSLSLIATMPFLIFYTRAM